MALDLLHREPKQALSFLMKRFPDLERNVSDDALTRVLKQRIIPTTLIVGEKAWSKAVDLRVAVGDLKEPRPMLSYVDTKIAQEVAADEACRLK
jgi:hypothetical protein